MTPAMTCAFENCCMDFLPFTRNLFRLMDTVQGRQHKVALCKNGNRK